MGPPPSPVGWADAVGHELLVPARSRSTERQVRERPHARELLGVGLRLHHQHTSRSPSPLPLILAATAFQLRGISRQLAGEAPLDSNEMQSSEEACLPGCDIDTCTMHGKRRRRRRNENENGASVSPASSSFLPPA